MENELRKHAGALTEDEFSYLQFLRGKGERRQHWEDEVRHFWR
ncbi:MAG TPA: hypothetical protein VJI75_05635 [Candidatus Nanoarchaeia archaeon]|nr:hypothetical protein [Candidatus Nanoarchaeia archaeon]